MKLKSDYENNDFLLLISLKVNSANFNYNLKSVDD